MSLSYTSWVYGNGDDMVIKKYIPVPKHFAVVWECEVWLRAFLGVNAVLDTML
jgi:hypothetical protein